MPEYPVQGDPTPFNHCIYAHRNRVNGKVYIGQATGNPKDRWGSNGINYKKQPYFWQAIQEYGWSNFDHIILMENLSQEDANAYERYWISQYRSNTEAGGYNRTSGGQGLRGLNESAKQKLKDSLNKYWASDEGRAQAKKHSLAIQGENNPMYGKRHSVESKQAMSEKHKGAANCNWNKTGIKHHLAKPVYCLELDQFFGSASEADRFLGVSAGYVSKCCNGKVATAGRHPKNGCLLHWRFATAQEVLKLKEALL